MIRDSLKCIVIDTKITEPFYNQALETYLLNKQSGNHLYVLLWRSDHAVFVGRNQVIWNECNMEAVRKHDFQIARRISGGGTVVHDQGNLNISIIMPKKIFSTDFGHSLIIKSLAELGISTAKNDKNDILIDGKKCSGTALRYKKGSVLHHLTLLIESDLNRISFLLKKPAYSVITAAVISKPSSIINLKEVNEGIDYKLIVKTIKSQLNTLFNEDYQIELGNLVNDKEIQAFSHLYASEEWVFDESPPFELELEGDLPSADIKIRIVVKEGRIGSLSLSCSQTLMRLADGFQDMIRFTRKGLFDYLDLSLQDGPGQIKDELLAWIMTIEI